MLAIVDLVSTSTAVFLQASFAPMGAPLPPLPLALCVNCCNCLHALPPLQVSFMEQKGDTHFKATLIWIAASDEKFCQRYGYSLEEFQAWEVQWLQSGRAREYGLDVQKDGTAGMHAARQRGRKASVAARRQRRLAGDAGAAAADQQAEA